MNWRKDAACYGMLPEKADAIFFNEDGASKPARAHCSACPVIAECRQWVDEVKPGYGFFAGETQTARRERLGINEHGNVITDLEAA